MGKMLDLTAAAIRLVLGPRSTNKGHTPGTRRGTKGHGGIGDPKGWGGSGKEKGRTIK